MQKQKPIFFLYVLSIALVTVGLISSYSIQNFFSDMPKAFAQSNTPSKEENSDNPYKNGKLPSNSEYNNQSEQFLKNLSIPLNKTLTQINNTFTGFENDQKDNWITANHDIFYTRNSNQTTIGKDNVKDLQVKWILNTPNPIENPPLIVGDTGYAEDNKANVIAFDIKTGLNLWTINIGEGGTIHGMTYDHGILFAPNGHSSSIVAINASTGKVMWKSPKLAPEGIGYHVVNPPIVWKNFVIAGSAGGDLPTEKGIVQGNVTALDRSNGKVLWNFKTTTGDWVKPEKVPPNGGATSWSGGAFDPNTGILYLPTGNPTPDFTVNTRPLPNKYSNSVIALNITNGKLIWSTPFVAEGTVLNVSLPNATSHDYDVAWGTNLVTIKDNNTQKNIVIGTDKRGDIIAMDAKTGKPLWTKTIGTIYRDNVLPAPPPNGSGSVWPGTQYGVESYSATDNDTLYVASSSMGFNYFLENKTSNYGYLVPALDDIKNGIGNGTITAIDIKTGKTKWTHPTEFPTWVSPLVTNGIVFSGHVTATGTPYTVNVFGAAINTPKIPSGIIMALDKSTGKKLWEFNVGAPIGIGGPSVGHGMLFVTTAPPAEIKVQNSGSIVAFGLPNNK